MSEHTLASATAEYNRLAESIGEKPVKSFRDKKTALARLGVMELKAGKAAKASPAPAPKAKKVKAVAEEGKKRGRKPLGFNFGAADTHTGELFHKEPREGSARAIALDLLKRAKGASFEEIKAVVDEHERGTPKTLNYRTTRLIRALNFSLGWEIIQEPNITGNIKAR